MEFNDLAVIGRQFEMPLTEPSGGFRGHRGCGDDDAVRRGFVDRDTVRVDYAYVRESVLRRAVTHDLDDTLLLATACQLLVGNG